MKLRFLHSAMQRAGVLQRMQVYISAVYKESEEMYKHSFGSLMTQGNNEKSMKDLARDLLEEDLFICAVRTNELKGEGSEEDRKQKRQRLAGLETVGSMPSEQPCHMRALPLSPVFWGQTAARLQFHI